MSNYSSIRGQVKFKTDAYKEAKKELLYVYFQTFEALKKAKHDMREHKPPTRLTKIIPILIPGSGYEFNKPPYLFADEIGLIKFDDRARTISVYVPNNNHAADQADEAKLYLTFCRHAGKIPKTGNTYGGTVYYQSEYGNHEENYGAAYAQAKKMQEAKNRIYR